MKCRLRLVEKHNLVGTGMVYRFQCEIDHPEHEHNLTFGRSGSGWFWITREVLWARRSPDART